MNNTPKTVVWLMAFVALSATVNAAESTAAGAAATDAVILDTKSFWRFRTVWETEEIVLPSGAIEHAKVDLKQIQTWYQKNQGVAQAPADTYSISKVDTVRLPAETSADWMKPDFDDSTWARLRGPMLADSNDDNWKLVLARGLFEVTDPAKAGDLTLSVSFRGGVVVYLNGEELTRSFLPKGDIGLYTPADPYPDDVYFTAKGFAFYRRPKDREDQPRVERRTRRLTGFRIPAAKLKKGVNVLAIANHRSPTPYNFYTSHNEGSYALHHDCSWGKIGLWETTLTAGAGAAVAPNTALLRNRGFKVWTQSIIQHVYLPDYPDPFSPTLPLRLTAVRNGAFSGQVIVGDDKPIVGLNIAVSDMKGAGSVPSSAFQIRYAVPNGKGKPVFFDTLEEEVPSEVPVYPEHGGAVQPVWITVRVPADAKAGDYTGTVTIQADGVKARTVPIELHVIDWKLPDTPQFVAGMDLIQSPESVAMAYDVPLWSDAHWKLLDKSFSLIGQLVGKSVYITAVRRTHFGNEHAMVRWVRDDNGDLQPNFDIVEKYLDLAMKYMGKIPAVILYVWEPMESEGHAGGAGTDTRMYDKPILLSVLDPATGNISARPGPAWGTPESVALWKRLNDGIMPVLKKRGLENSLLLGLLGDTRPTRQAMDDVCNSDTNRLWAIHAHQYCDVWKGYKVGMAAFLWGIGVEPVDPSFGYSYGWSNPLWLNYYPREMEMASTLVEHRVKLERWMGGKRPYTPFIATGSGPRGLGRVGADFWDVLKDSNGRIRGSLAGRYPESYWGQLNLNYCISYVLGKGKKSPVATVRYEAFREGIEEVETRIYLEKVLLDAEAVASLGNDLTERCRAALDERIRMCLHSEGEGQSWYISSDWGRRMETLFGLASEVSKKLGREPRPVVGGESAKRVSQAYPPREPAKKETKPEAAKEQPKPRTVPKVVAPVKR